MPHVEAGLVPFIQKFSRILIEKNLTSVVTITYPTRGSSGGEIERILLIYRRSSIFDELSLGFNSHKRIHSA